MTGLTTFQQIVMLYFIINIIILILQCISRYQRLSQNPGLFSRSEITHIFLISIFFGLPVNLFFAILRYRRM